MLKVAIIGCGGISCMHLDAAAALEEAEIVAVCDIKADKAQKAAEKYGTKPYTNYIDMFNNEQLDAVHICLPHYIHTTVACEAFKRGINVISEKPMSIKYEDAAAAVDLAEKCGVKYGVIFQCRYNTPSELVKKRIRDGRLGKVKCGRIALTWYRSDNYYNNSDIIYDFVSQRNNSFIF